MLILVLSLALVGLWLVLVCLFIGIGSLVLGKGGGLDDGWPAAHAAFWAGAGIVTTALLVWHLWLRVDGIALGIVVAIGVAGIVARPELWRACLRESPRWPMTLIAGASALWVANHALDSAAIDDYLYEYQAIRWNHDFAIVPGLANLHGRLGFNESHHLLAAMLSVGPLAGRVNHVVNGLLVSVFLLYLLAGLWELRRVGGHRGSVMLRAFLIAPVAGLAVISYWGSTISTLKADVLVACAILAVTCLLVEFADAEWSTPAYRRAAVTLFLACGFALSLKLSAAAFVVVVIAGAFGRVAADWGHRRHRPDTLVLAALVLNALTLLVVPLRSVVLSGYPVYPSPVLAANVDWKVSPAQLRVERAMLTSWARERPTYDLARQQDWRWVPHWARETTLGAEFELLLPVTLSMMCLAAAFTAPRSTAGPRTPRWALMTLAAAGASALAVWWSIAPASRFSVGPFWSVAGVAVLWVVERHEWSRAATIATALTGFGLLGLLLWILGGGSGSAGVTAVIFGACAWLIAFGSLQRSGPALAVLCGLLACAQPLDHVASFLVHRGPAQALAVLWLRPSQYMTDWSEGYPVVPRQTNSGLTIYVTGSTSFHTPLPNTRFFNPYLELRRPGTLSSGFRLHLPPGVDGYGYPFGTAAPGSEH